MTFGEHVAYQLANAAYLALKLAVTVIYWALDR